MQGKYVYKEDIVIKNVDIKLSAHFWEKARSNKVKGPKQDI
jgi:hypothetical protein